jgi:hypothetical protein
MRCATFFLSLVAAASANVYVTSPVAGTVFTAGQNSTITWKDDGMSPPLQSFGPAKVSIYIGNAQQQTSLQLIVSSVDVSTTSSIIFIPDGTIGPSGSDYFIRFESLSLKDATNSQYPAEAFSAKFTLNGATGQFTPQEQSEIDGQSTAPLGGSTSVSSHAVSTPASSTHTSSNTGSTPTASGSQHASSNGAVGINAGRFITGILVGVVGVFLSL